MQPMHVAIHLLFALLALVLGLSLPLFRVCVVHSPPIRNPSHLSHLWSVMKSSTLEPSASTGNICISYRILTPFKCRPLDVTVANHYHLLCTSKSQTSSAMYSDSAQAV